MNLWDQSNQHEFMVFNIDTDGQTQKYSCMCVLVNLHVLSTCIDGKGLEVVLRLPEQQ